MTDVLFPGYMPDPSDSHCGTLTDADGNSRRVFLKRSRSLERHDCERLVLGLIGQVGVPPVPQLLAAYPDAANPILALAYIDGANLADLLVPGPLAAPRPAWYESTWLEPPPVRELLPLLAELGRAVRDLHAIKLEQFGKLVGEEPNPHRLDARAHTRQEAAFRIHLALEKGHISPELAQCWLDWVDRYIEVIKVDEPPCLIHYDLHAGNVRVARDLQSGEWRLKALYDFELGRAWLPEWDLAAMHSDLGHLEGDQGEAWSSFQEGYGSVDPERLRLFEFVRGLSAVAYGERYPPWAAWSRRRLEAFLNPCEGGV
jgi:aminoglycoside phosphotransferase (APT) family kinase protein